MVDVAQLVRALVCGTKGRGFESHLPPLRYRKIRFYGIGADFFIIFADCIFYR